MNGRARSVMWGTFVCLAWTAPARASDSLAGLLACRGLADAAARLACFDREAAALVPSPGASAAAAAPTAVPQTPPAAAPTVVPQTPPAAALAAPPTPPPATHPAPLLDQQQQFGLPERAVAAKEVAAGTRAADAAKIEAHIVQLSAAPDGRMVFSLDNGQVWRQLLVEGDLLAKPNDAVTISRALLGSYWLELSSKRGCKVMRVR
jgi:hypothetical protein